MKKARGSRRRLAPIVALVAALVASCGGGDEGDGVGSLPPPPTFQAACADSGAVPAAASVTGRCAALSGVIAPVEIVITDTPPGEEIISAVLDVTFNPLVASFDSCSAGPALGSAGELTVQCDVVAGNSGELLAVVGRLGTGPGRAVAGTQVVLTLNFRVARVGSSPLGFLGINTPNGTALLRRDPADPTAPLQVVAGVTFDADVTLTGS